MEELTNLEKYLIKNVTGDTKTVITNTTIPEVIFSNENIFPENVFPIEIENMLKSFSVSNNIKYDIMTTHFLCAFGFALCHRYEVKIHKTWFIRPNLWVITISQSGTNKTGLMQSVYKPIVDKDFELKVKFESDVDIYKKQQKMEKLKVKQKKNPDAVNLCAEDIINIQQHLDNQSGFNFAEPRLLSVKNEDFTFAEILSQLDYKHNDGRQQIVIYDEMLGLFKSFNSYGGTHDEEIYNKLYDYGSYTVKRKNSELNSVIREKCVCLGGSTQKPTLFQMFIPERIYNGNIYRHCFAIDDDKEFVNPLNNINNKDNLTYDEHLERYCKIITKLLANFHYNINRKEIKYSPEAFEYWKHYIDECNEIYGENDNSLSVFGKMINTITKYVIIINRLNTIDYSAEEPTIIDTDNNLIISLDEIKKACRINDFYLKNIFKVLDYTGNKINKVAKNFIELEFIEELPQSFSTAIFIDKYMLKMNVSESTANRRLKKFKNDGFFKKNKQGEYYKPN
jgi:hypothetical protein